MPMILSMSLFSFFDTMNLSRRSNNPKYFTRLYLNKLNVSFEVDTGVDHVKSNAVVFAMDEADAINMIKKHISERCFEDSVEEVFFCRPFTGLLFTEKFGWR